MRGNVILAPEITLVSKHGFWLLVADEELFVAFFQFPWFRNATIDQLMHVEQPTDDHLYWPDLDIDLSVESLRNPCGFPLMSKVVG